MPASISRLLCLSLCSNFCLHAEDIVSFMPEVNDVTQMTWADGFPGHSPKAEWLRVVQTGRFALAMNTETLQIKHLGPVAGLEADWRSLPAAELGLHMLVDGKNYHCTAGGKWSRFTGPRLIESGRFFQRGDVTDLAFAADDGSRLNVEARLETAAWPDRVSMSLVARPGVAPLPAGETAFGRVAGGFGLDGTNHLDIPYLPEMDAEQFTVEFWAFVPSNYQAGKVSPWLMCRGAHEAAEGNIGIIVVNGKPRARMNIGGGGENSVQITPSDQTPLKLDEWNHLAVSYDGDVLRLFLNGNAAGEAKVGKNRVPGKGGMTFGRRQDNFGDGYHFRGVVDEIRLYTRALALAELRPRWQKPESPQPSLNPAAAWTFQSNGKALMLKPREAWKQAALMIKLANPKDMLQQRWELPAGQAWADGEAREVTLAIDPVAFKTLEAKPQVTVAATEFPSNGPRPVVYEPTQGWHRINLDAIEPTSPPGGKNPSNDAIERVKLVLSNPTDQPQLARLMFEKTKHGIHQHIGTPITGISAILRDRDGLPTGIPVQLSKNWHVDPLVGTYASQWFHGISQVRLPAKAQIELELTLSYGHWGGVAAASHSQLCLIGWGSNQLWDQSALGAWGESICYEPDQAQADCTITDVRPVMLRNAENKQWKWTNNLGGGDFFRNFTKAGERVPPSAMQTTYHKQGPCLTEVSYTGRSGLGVKHSATVSLARTDDLVRGIYRLRLDVSQATDFSRFVIFQIGADTYNATRERKMALGNETGLLNEWSTQWGGNIYRSEPLACSGRIPWISLHDGELQHHQVNGIAANRGIVIRAWKAKLGGKECGPWIAEHGTTIHKTDASTLDLVPPPGVTRLEPGDFVEATLEHLLMPKSAADYYGPNLALRAALTKDANTWHMIHREAKGNDRQIDVKIGKLLRAHPSITISTEADKAEFTLTGGHGYVPVTFTGLRSAKGALLIDDKPLNQSIHGNDFWQTDYDSASKTWSQTYNVPINAPQPHVLRFGRF